MSDMIGGRLLYLQLGVALGLAICSWRHRRRLVAASSAPVRDVVAEAEAVLAHPAADRR